MSVIPITKLLHFVIGTIQYLNKFLFCSLFKLQTPNTITLVLYHFNIMFLDLCYNHM